MDEDKALTGVFAGHWRLAFERATASLAEAVTVPVSEPYDIIVTIDATMNHYQAAKAAVGALPVLTDGGVLIQIANSSDGVGDIEYVEELALLMSLPHHRDYIDLICQRSNVKKDQWEVEMWCHVLDKVGGAAGLIYCTTGIEPAALAQLPLTSGYAYTGEHALEPMVQKAIDQTLEARQRLLGRRAARGGGSRWRPRRAGVSCRAGGGMTDGALIFKPPRRGADPLPILVSIPHYGTEALPHIGDDDYTEPWFRTFAYGFADAFAPDLYSDLHQHGATVLATPISRIFVDLNRRRTDFKQEDGIVRSTRGVVRTHTIREAPIFTRDLRSEELEARLTQYYDPYYAALNRELQQIRAAHGYALLLDAHTGSPRRMLDYQVIIGTRHGATSHDAIGDRIDAIFTQHGFEVHHNISGYVGGNIVRTYGQPVV